MIERKAFSVFVPTLEDSPKRSSLSPKTCWFQSNFDPVASGMILRSFPTVPLLVLSNLQLPFPENKLTFRYEYTVQAVCQILSVSKLKHLKYISK